MKNIEIFNFRQEKFDTGVAVADVQALYVNVVSGDEILTIFKKDGYIEQFDAADYHYHRDGGHPEGQYAVYADGMEEWCRRKRSDPWWEDIENA